MVFNIFILNRMKYWYPNRTNAVQNVSHNQPITVNIMVACTTTVKCGIQKDVNIVHANLEKSFV